MIRSFLTLAAATLIATLWMSGQVHGGCNCNKGGAAAVPVTPVSDPMFAGGPAYAAPAYPAPVPLVPPGYGGPQYSTPSRSGAISPSQPYSTPSYGGAGGYPPSAYPGAGYPGAGYPAGPYPGAAMLMPVPTAGGMYPGAPAAGVAPPPGTLGYTYRRYTRPVPDDKHPRIAMLEVYGAPAGVKLTVHGMDGFVDNKGVWHFETEKPPVTGLSLVRQVLVWNDDGTLNRPLVRSIRLIQGRIVELDY